LGTGVNIIGESKVRFGKATSYGGVAVPKFENDVFTKGLNGSGVVSPGPMNMGPKLIKAATAPTIVVVSNVFLKLGNFEE
jgi:hypothetical protein